MTENAILDETTRRAEVRVRHDPPPSRLMLTIALHPELRRIGERAELPALARGESVELSRRAPDFHIADGRRVGPLADPFLSRSPIVLRAASQGVVIDAAGRGEAILVDDRALDVPRLLDPPALSTGVRIALAERVVVVLHAHRAADESLPKYGLVGESAAIQGTRRSIAQAAGLHIPVLIRGESGTGKELVARAIHAASARAAQPYLSLNMAALNPQTAVAELFGHERGSFTGAVKARPGYFREAEGGTIFLDEIGEAPIEIQVMLLRVLESGELQPLGGALARRVDVRVLAATDADLEAATLRGDFRPSLLHRLAGYELHVPPLRRRRDDIARLLVHFIGQEMRRTGQDERFEQLAADASGLLSTALISRLLRYDWPGNVRQLSNVARRLVTALVAEQDPSEWGSLLVDDAVEPVAPGAVASATVTAPQLSDEELLAALRAHDWQITAPARHLGIARNTLYARMRRCGVVRRARDISREDLVDVYRRHGGDLAVIAEALNVSLRGLQLRLRELGLIA